MWLRATQDHNSAPVCFFHLAETVCETATSAMQSGTKSTPLPCRIADLLTALLAACGSLLRSLTWSFSDPAPPFLHPWSLTSKIWGYGV